MKTAVDKVHRGKRRVLNTRFEAMASHFMFEPDFCNSAAGWEKGWIEKMFETPAIASGIRLRHLRILMC